MDPNLNVTKVNKVYTAQVISDDPDEKCETGQHIRKIYSNQTNTTRRYWYDIENSMVLVRIKFLNLYEL